MVTTFEAGGKLYELRYSFNALCEFEGKYDIGVSKLSQTARASTI